MTYDSYCISLNIRLLNCLYLINCSFGEGKKLSRSEHSSPLKISTVYQFGKHPSTWGGKVYNLELGEERVGTGNSQM